MNYTTSTPKDTLLNALERRGTALFILSLACVALGGLAFIQWKDRGKIERELDRVKPDLRNYDAGYRAGHHDGLMLAGRLSIWDIHTGVCGSQIIRVLGIPDSVKVVATLPTGEPSAWTWKYGNVTLVLRVGEVEGEEYLIGHDGPLRELVESKRAERDSKLNDF